MNFFDQREASVKEIFHAVKKAGGRAYIVGGFVRDHLLNIPQQQDIDIEIYGLDKNELYQLLKHYGHVDEIGKSFGVFKLKNLPQYDFALARTEVKTGPEHQSFNVSFDKTMDFKTACKRRDLTINSILYDPIQDEYIDVYSGIKDIHDGIIRMVNASTFSEDSLRVLRVARFVARFPNFRIDEETKKQCKLMVPSLTYLSKERVFHEYTHILMAELPSAGFQFLQEINALPEEIEALVHTHQRLDFHPEGSVFNHTMLVIDLAALCKDKTKKPEFFMWAALLHDIGKPAVTTPLGKAPNHDLVGQPIAYDFMLNLSNNKSLALYVSLMVRCHMALMVASRNGNKPLPYLRILKRLEGAVDIDDLILLSKCDKLGRKRIDTASIEKFDIYINKMKEKYGMQPQKAIITGNHLIQLGYQPDARFKEILEDVYYEQLTGKTEKELIKYIVTKYPR